MYRSRYSQSEGMSPLRICAVIGLLVVLAVLAVMAAPILPGSRTSLGSDSQPVVAEASTPIPRDSADFSMRPRNPSDL